MKRMTFFQTAAMRAVLLFVLGSGGFAGGEEAKPEPADVGTREELKLPGLTVHTKARFVDVEAEVCLGEGFLELIACTKGSKEHESIIAVGAKAAHIHAALLLLRAQPGNPAISRLLDDGRWLDIAPKGSEVDVSLVIQGEKGEPVERPISDFIQRAKGEEIYDPAASEKAAEDKGKFPTHTFLFAGSQLYKGEDGKVRYLSDESGNVISLASFGDELLSLPGKHSQDNSALYWEIDSTHLPAVGTKVILRLRPKQAADAEQPKP